MKKKLMIVIPSIVLIAALIVIILNLTDRNKKQPIENPITSTALSGTDNVASTVENPNDEETVIPMDGDMNFKETNVDLDNDGVKENIKISAETTGSDDQGGIQEVTGRLIITGNGGTDDISFINKPQGLSGIISGIKFIDLDGDGVKDVLISIPNNGTTFTSNGLFIFNYKTKSMFSLPGDESDFSLDNFAKGFTFSYKGNGILDIKNTDYNFKESLNLKNNDNIDNSEDTYKKYDNSWVDSTPVMMDDISKLKLIKDKNNKIYIKMPLAIYGVDSSDVIGEVQLYFDVNSDFKTVFRKFEVIGYEGNNKVVLGEANAKSN